jgi:hypothetical protein
MAGTARAVSAEADQVKEVGPRRSTRVRAEMTGPEWVMPSPCCVCALSVRALASI